MRSCGRRCGWQVRVGRRGEGVGRRVIIILGAFELTAKHRIDNYM